MKRLAQIFRAHPLLASAFALALVVTLMFTVRTVMFAVYWADPANRDQALQGWMTPRYVAYSWDVPRDIMQTATGPQPDRLRPTLREVAEHQDIALADLLIRIEAAIVAYRATAGQ